MSVAEKLVTVAENVAKVYEAGKAAGGSADGYNEGYAAGVQSEHDRFWDNYQQNGTLTQYDYAFSGLRWTNETFNPKYDIKPIKAAYMFRDSGLVGDLVNILNDLGVVLDLSNCTDHIQAFRGMRQITRLPVIDFTMYISLNYAFCENPRLEIIDKIILNTAKTYTFTNAFMGDICLREIRFEGVIANDIDFQWSPLSKASIKNIMSCLSDTISGTTVSFNLDAVNTAFETSEGAADGSESEEWATLIATKPNWTITLV